MKLIKDVAVVETEVSSIQLRSSLSVPVIRMTVSRSSSDYEVVVTQGELVDMLYSLANTEQVTDALDRVRIELFNALLDKLA